MRPLCSLASTILPGWLNVPGGPRRTVRLPVALQLYPTRSKYSTPVAPAPRWLSHSGIVRDASERDKHWGAMVIEEGTAFSRGRTGQAPIQLGRGLRQTTRAVHCCTM